MTRRATALPAEPADWAGWLAGLGHAAKDRLLARVLTGGSETVVAELRRRYRSENSSPLPATGRTVAELLAARDEAARQAEQDRAAAEAARVAALDRLLVDEAGTWARIDKLLGTTLGVKYREAALLLVRLTEAYARRGDRHRVRGRVRAIRAQNARSPMLSRCLDEVGL